MAVGMVVGAGIFKSPTAVAQNTPDVVWLLGLWALGGVISLIGALCYAELSAAFPDRGGDYHFLRLAYGRTLAFLFAWARFMVVNTGSLALLGFVLGDYLQAAWPLGPYGPAIYAAIAVLAVTGLNLRRLSAGIEAQEWLTWALLAGLALVIGAGFLAAGKIAPPAVPAPSPLHFGQALVLVLLAYGGWNEVTTLSADLRGGPRAMLPLLIISLGMITALYLAVNAAFAYGLGFAGLAGAPAPAYAVVEKGLGGIGQFLILGIVIAAVITSINATVIAGSRTTFAAAADWPQLRFLAGFDAESGVARSAAIAQCLVALALVGMGAISLEGFRTLVDYTAPVYWLFLCLSGLAVIVLRVRLPKIERPFRTPLFPLAPLIFAGAGGYMVYSSILYVRQGAMFGLGVLALGALAAGVLHWGEARAASRTQQE